MEVMAAAFGRLHGHRHGFDVPRALAVELAPAVLTARTSTAYAEVSWSPVTVAGEELTIVAGVGGCVVIW
jgi:hypothetical protein